VKLDFRHYPDGYVVTAKDVEPELSGQDTGCVRWLDSGGGDCGGSG
jgi:hypothetical protein